MTSASQSALPSNHGPCESSRAWDFPGSSHAGSPEHQQRPLLHRPAAPREPPSPAVLDRNQVGQLLITNNESGIRLRLKLSASLTADIMVFGQAPCSAYRNKRRNVSYVGLLPQAQDGLCNITALYVARYGTSCPGEKHFIVTRQQEDGWAHYDHQTSEIVPEPPTVAPALATLASTLKVYMHKGCTRDAQGTNWPSSQDARESKKQVPPPHGEEPAPRRPLPGAYPVWIA